MMHEEDVDDCTMCVCGSPVAACEDYWDEGTDREVGSPDADQ